MPHLLLRWILEQLGLVPQRCEVKKIRMREGAAESVILSAWPTFMELVGRDYPDPSHVSCLRSFRYGAGTSHTMLNPTQRDAAREWD